MADVMENDFLKYNNKDDSENQPDEESESSANRRRSSFARRGQDEGLFKRMFEAGDEDEDEDEDEEEDSSNKSKRRLARFRMPFRKLFRGEIVSPPERIEASLSDSSTHDSGESVVPRADFGDWLKKMGRVNIVDSASERPINDIHEIVNNILDYQADDPINSGESSSVVAMDSSEHYPHVDLEVEAENDSKEGDYSSFAAPSEVNNLAQEAVSPMSEPESVQRILARQAAANYGFRQPAEVVEANQPATQNTVQNITNETYINNNGWGPALVVDQLSRHRDRKIKKIVKQQDKKIDSLKITQQQDNNPENVGLGNKEVTESVPRPEVHRQGIQQNTEIIPVPDIRRVAVENNPPQAQKYENQSIYNRLEQIETPVNIEKNTTHNIQNNAEKIIEKPSSLIEREHEKRHEIKDKHSYNQIAEGAIKAREYDNNLPSVTSPATINASENVYQTHNVEQKNESSKSMYKQAARNGVGVAVAVLIAFLVIYTISR